MRWDEYHTYWISCAAFWLSPRHPQSHMSNTHPEQTVYVLNEMKLLGVIQKKAVGLYIL